MSAIIYSAPKKIKKPEINFSNFDRAKYMQDELDYIEALREDIKRKGYRGKNSGKIIKFQVADGYAKYMVLQLRPLSLIHLPLDDGYQAPNVDLMTASRVNEMINAEEMLEAFFKKNNSATDEEIQEVLDTVGINTKSITEKRYHELYDPNQIIKDYFLIGFNGENYLLPKYDTSYEHRIFKVIVNNHSIKGV